MSRYSIRYKAILLLFVLWSVPLFAQNGSIQGLVRDHSGAVIIGAEITITNVATGVITRAQTNDSGLYTVPFLTPGHYNISAAKTGFTKLDRNNITLDVAEQARVDFTLDVGAVTTAVNVSGNATPLDTESSTVGQVIDNRQVVELPLNGRNYLELARLTAGVAPSNGSRPDANGSFSALGQHGFQTNVILDGVDNNSRASGGELGWQAQSVTPSIDSVAEFKVVTNNISAEYGYRMGGTVIVETKSGTNEFHGSAYEFLRNDDLDATNFFSVGQPKPSYQQNQFGGTLGGPIIKNRTFFFGSFEGTRINEGTTSISSVPTSSELAGDFSAIGKVIYDPATTTETAAGVYTRTPFPGNIIPADRFDAVSKKVLALYPQANLPGLVNNYYYSATGLNNTNEVDSRIDHDISDTERVYFRYSWRGNYQYTPGMMPLPADGATSQDVNLTSNSGVGSLNSTLSPTLNNEFRVGVSHVNSIIDIPLTTNYNAELGITGIPNLGNGNTDNLRGMAEFSPSGYTPLGQTCCWPNHNNFNVEQANDILSWTHGRHNVTAGIAFLREDIYRLAARLSRGSMSFNGSFTEDPNNRGDTGSGLADFLLGDASSATIGNEAGEDSVAHNYSAFLQDDWHLSSHLTLNLGVRWDLFELPHYPNSQVSRLDIFPGTPDYGKYQYPTNSGDCGCTYDYKNFAPRVGFAWQVLPKTVVRSGFGIFYATPDMISGTGLGFANQAPAWTEITFPTDRLFSPALIVSNGFPPGLVPTTTLEPDVSATAAYSYIPTQYSLEWFTDVQRELPDTSVLTVSYIGSGTRHLLVGLNLNQPLTPGPGSVQSRRPNTFYSGISLETPIGLANYEALTAKYEKRYSHGLTLLASYTLSHAIDDVSEVNTEAQGQGIVNNYDLTINRGNSAFNVPQRLIISAIYDLPFGHGRTWLNTAGPLDWILGGWQIAGIVTSQSGIPFTPTVSTDLTNVGQTDHPNRTGSGLLSSGQSIADWFDVAEFPLQAQYTYGNSGRDILRGPALNNLDFKVGKSFAFSEIRRLEFRAEFFNFTNTPYFGLPSTNVDLAGAGQITTAGAPREIQFALKFLF